MKYHFVLTVLMFSSSSFATPPVDCFDASTGRGLSDELKVTLCSGADSSVLVCFAESSGRGLSEKQRTRLCAGLRELK